MIEIKPREKTLILLAIAIFIPLILFRFIIYPLQNTQTSQTQLLQQQRTRLNQIHLLGQQYEILMKDHQAQTLSLSKRTDAILNQLELKSQSRVIIEDTPGRGQRLVIKLEESYLKDLVELIYRIEDAKPVILIESLDIQPAFKNKRLLRVSMALSSH